MDGELLILLKVPAGSLADELRARHGIQERFHEVRIEADMLVFSFTRPVAGEGEPPAGPAPRTTWKEPPVAKIEKIETRVDVKPAENPRSGGRRRKKAKRNRMKTRGWSVVAKIQNSKGQTAVIYRPFVDALFGRTLTPAQQRAKVAEILRSNGNDPTEASVEYFLNNTLEYLAEANKDTRGA